MGQLRLPGPAGSVPVKSMVSASPAISARTLMTMSSSVTPSPSMASWACHSPSGSAAMAARVRRSEYASRASMAASIAAAPPRRPASSTTRSSASRWAASCAARSPRRSSGVRELARMSSINWASTPSGVARRMGGMTSPSCTSSRAPAGMDPALMPPTSAWWARVTACATTIPFTAMGETMVMSGR